ncbi:uncharacterized protein LOC114329035 [Diabrotica virgifera virgifera]|uniref:Saposin B-type domain-containing protein n=1 Tax=Diabrotica virgifera virgifera TaxID=50390 RepID=A0ABM5IIW5_DIAVI|nr:uncharacterized protein LOC114329035 [Diabrotica virgifera virgifera]
MKATLVLAVLVCVVGLTVSAPQTSDHCNACVGFSSMVKNYVLNQRPLEEVEKDSEDLCQRFYDMKVRNFCENKLISKVDEIYYRLTDWKTPQEVCEILKYC